jgi:hypothetical protein
MRVNMYRADADQNKATREELKVMEKAFIGRGNLENWSAEVLGKIDECFVKRYMNGDMPISTFFFPGNENGSYDLFLQYCGDVDQVLRLNESGAPPYAREYFAYYTIWQMRGFSFPVPLGTASVVEALHTIASLVPLGFTEVRCISMMFLDLVVRVIVPRSCDAVRARKIIGHNILRARTTRTSAEDYRI